MLVRNIAGIQISTDRRVGLAAPVTGNPFAYGTDAGQVASPVNVQSDTGPLQGYINASNILTGSVAGDPAPTVATPANATPNVVTVSGDTGGMSLGTLLLMGGAVAGTIYLLSTKPKSRGTVTGTKKGNLTVPILIGAGALAIYFMSRSGNPAAAPVNPVTAVTIAPATGAATSIFQKLSLIPQT